MQSTTQRLHEEGLIQPPKFLPEAVHYETQVGSVAYGVSQDQSDLDIYGFCVPPKAVVFPHLNGVISGFGRQIKRFDQFQQHHIDHPQEPVVYDLSIYSIVRYFSLCMENNPNMLESLFTPEDCVLHASEIGQRVRAHRKLFLHKGSFHKFKGFSYSQIHKMNIKQPEGKRAKMVEQYGFDVKFAYHAVRLLDFAEQVLTTHDLDLQAGKDKLIEIRQGQWTKAQVESYCEQKEVELEALYEKSTLRHKPDEDAIKRLLLTCLEDAYGSLEGCIGQWDTTKDRLV